MKSRKKKRPKELEITEPKVILTSYGIFIPDIYGY